MIIDYGIIERASSEQVVRAVHKLIRDGWEPQGGISLIHKLESSWRTGERQYWIKTSFVQAVVKRGDDENNSRDRF
jgi:hypothetical protein